MLEILDKKDCCGCSACVNICPERCIDFLSDNEGFLYPQVDKSVCIGCGLCRSVCPIINKNEPIGPVATYAAKNRDGNIRLNSSSGGIFTLLAENVIQRGGVVFGAKFDSSWAVVHSYTESIEGLAAFRGSKYVQSYMGDNYKLARKFLLDGRMVLFSGTPCQIAGLKTFLRKGYENLLLVEVVCHGVPSPAVWKDYLKYRQIQAKNIYSPTRDTLSSDELPRIEDISFRDKSKGWKNYCIRIRYAVSYGADNSSEVCGHGHNCEITPFRDDIFMKGFLKNLFLRPSCYDCRFKKSRSGADISIADYWGIQDVHPSFDDDKGTGLVIVNTCIGSMFYNLIRDKIMYRNSQYDKAVSSNPCIVKSVEMPEQRELFWNSYNNKGIESISDICRLMEPSYKLTLVERVIRKLKMIFGI